MRHLRRSVTLLSTLVPALAAQRAETRYVAPTSETIITQTEMSASSVPGHIVWVLNHSTVPIIVYSYQLVACENVKEFCGPRRINVKVRPAGRAVIARVFAKNAEDGFGYRLRFGYRTDSSDIAALRVLAGAGNNDAQQRLDATRAAEADARRVVGAADVYLDDAAVAALGGRLASMRTEPDSIVIRDGRSFLLREVRLMALDSAGNLLGRLTVGYRWSYEGSQILMNHADTLLALMPGRTAITFRLSVPGRVLEAVLPVFVVPDPAPPVGIVFRKTETQRRCSHASDAISPSACPATIAGSPAFTARLFT